VNTFRAAFAHPIGVAIGDMLPPEQIAQTARWLETLGYSHVTVPEDCFYLPAQVGATLALGATERIPVGTSLVSAMTRHPAILAMEIAGISRAFPGRFWPTIGLGLPLWLEQMGLMPERPVAAVREVVESVKRLLAGETVTLDGSAVTLDAITITHPAEEEVPVTLGVIGPRMLRLSGQIADATLFAASAGAKYFEQAIGHVRAGLERARRPADAMAYRTIALACVDRDGERARSIARPVLAGFLAEFADMHTVTGYGITEELNSMIERGGADAVAREMPDQWLEDLALVGTPREVADKALHWVAAGIGAIAIFLPHESERDTLTLVAEEVVPLVAQSREWRD
jgi:alkanesulfonate monooxygenase SsuD/methylene tetrahydromethanopterin reductase-like flavin-dependent oxidoreductase (luciferase family)